MGPKIRAVITHPFYIAYMAFCIFVCGTWVGDLSARAQMDPRLGALPSPPMSDLGDLDLTGYHVAATPSDEAYRGNHRMIVEATGREGIEAACSDDAMACGSSYTNTVYIPNPCLYREDAYASLLCHEMAHVKGWKHEPGVPAWGYPEDYEEK